MYNFKFSHSVVVCSSKIFSKIKKGDLDIKLYLIMIALHLNESAYLMQCCKKEINKINEKVSLYTLLVFHSTL